MSSSKDNTVYKKTSFLAGMNVEFIREFYADYLADPKSLPESWKSFFDGLNDDQKLVFEDLRGPTWSPEKKFKKLREALEDKEEIVDDTINVDLKSAKQASKDSVRAIMLIRAYRIRGHLIANLDPLSIQKESTLNLNLKHMVSKSDYERKIFLDGVLGLQYADLKQILEILKRTYCSTIGYEFMHMGDPDEKAWIRDRIEGPEKILHSQKTEKAILNKIIQAEGSKNIYMLNL